jgi:hypothetical protein
MFKTLFSDSLSQDQFSSNVRPYGKLKMVTYSYKVRETQNDGYIAYEAVDEQTGEVIPLESPMISGAYPIH